MGVSDILLLLLAVVLFAIIGSIYKAREKLLKQLKDEYDEALQGNDKKLALEAGRKYYSALRRKQQLTIYDEQAISNDLSTMDDVLKLRR